MDLDVTVQALLLELGPSVGELFGDLGVALDPWDRGLNLVELCRSYELDVQALREAIDQLRLDQALAAAAP